MYMPPHFRAADRDTAIALMRAHPLASLVSTQDDGFPWVTHLPLHLEQRGDALVLLGHCARANPHWRHLQTRPEALVCFMGPQAYLSPRVYPDLARVPTWNYLAVHARVRASLIEEAEAKDRLLKKLIGDHDPDYIAQWIALGPAFQQRMLAGIMGFALEIVDWQCKIKLNQHRPEAHAAMRAVYAAGDDGERALGVWMDRLGLGGHPPPAEP